MRYLTQFAILMFITLSCKKAALKVTTTEALKSGAKPDEIVIDADTPTVVIEDQFTQIELPTNEVLEGQTVYIEQKSTADAAILAEIEFGTRDDRAILDLDESALVTVIVDLETDQLVVIDVFSITVPENLMATLEPDQIKYLPQGKAEIVFMSPYINVIFKVRKLNQSSEETADEFTVPAPGENAISYSLNVAASIQAGDNLSVAVSALTASSIIDTEFSGSVTLVCSGAVAGCGSISLSNGTGTLSISDQVAETVYISLASPVPATMNLGSGASVDILPGPVSEFRIADPADDVTFQTVSVNISAWDQFGNPATGYSNNTDLALVCTGTNVNGCIGALNFVNGQVTRLIDTDTAQTINLSLSELVTTPADTTSTQDVIISFAPDLVDDDSSATGFGGLVSGYNLSTTSSGIELRPFISENQRELEPGQTNFMYNGLIALWNFSGIANTQLSGGSMIGDATGNSRDLTVFTGGTDPYIRDSPLGESLEFDHTQQQYLRISDAATGGAFDFGSNPFTINLWVKKLSDHVPVQYSSIACKGNGLDGWCIEYYQNNLISIGIYTGGAIYLELQSDPTIQSIDVGDWTMITLVLFDIGTSQHLYLLVNGEIHAEGWWTGGAIGDNTDPLYIGQWGDDDPNGFSNFELDEFSIWDRSLTFSEISALYSRRSAPYPNGGQFTSRVMDSGSGTGLSLLKVTPGAPYNISLPTPSDSETYYPTANASPTLQSGLISLWRFDAAVAPYANITSVSDVIGTNDGSASGTFVPRYLVRSDGGLIGESAFFYDSASPADSEITVLHNGTIDFTGEWSISVWIAVEKLPPTDASSIVSKAGAADGYGLYLHSDGSIALAGGNGGWDLTVTNELIIPGRIYHIVGTYAANDQNIYINGAEATYSSGGNYPNLPGSTNENLVIGNCTYCTILVDKLFEGVVDELALWNRVVTPAEALRLMMRGAYAYRIQYRSCGLNDCSDETNFYGPGGSVGSWFYPDSVDFSGLPTFDISPNPNRYYQYRLEAFLRIDPRDNFAGVIPGFQVIELIP